VQTLLKEYFIILVHIIPIFKIPLAWRFAITAAVPDPHGDLSKMAEL